MALDCKPDSIYIACRSSKDAKLSENGLVPIIRCDLNKGPLSRLCDSAVIQTSVHQLRKGARLSDYRQIREFWPRSQGTLNRYEIDLIEMTSGIFEEVELLTPHGLAKHKQKSSEAFACAIPG